MKKVDISKFHIWWIMIIVLLAWFASIIFVQRYLEEIFNENISIIMLIITTAIILLCILASDIRYYFRNAKFFRENNTNNSRFYIERVPFRKKKIDIAKSKLLAFINKKGLEDNTFEIYNTFYLGAYRVSKYIKLKFLFDNQVAESIIENQYIIKVIDGNIDNSDFENYEGVNCIICQEDEAIKVFLEIKTGLIYDRISNMHGLRILNKIFHKGDKILLIDEALLIYHIIANRIS